MPSYIKTFYPQSQSYQARFNIGVESRFDTATFGLSGQTGISFSLASGIVWHNGQPITSLDANNFATVDVCGSGNNHTVWSLGSPILHGNTPLSFSAATGSVASEGTFSTEIVGIGADLSHSLSGMLDDQSGYLYVVNNGAHDVDILNATWLQSFSKFSSFPSSIAPGQTGNFLFELLGNNNISGTGIVSIDTNGGTYTGEQYTNKEWGFSGWGIPMYANPGITYPSGTSVLRIVNEADYDRDFNVSLLTGYSGTARYADIRATGSFTTAINETVTGVNIFQRDYSGVFSGQGGRLNAVASSIFTGTANVQVAPTGNVTHNYQINSSGIIMGELFLGVLTGSVSGTATGGLGGVQFDQQETGNVAIAYSAVDGEPIFPGPTDIFTGQLDFFEPAVQYFGNVDYYVYENLQVFEGSGEFADLWNLQIDDYDAGTIDYGLSGYSGVSGLFNSGVVHRIPANSTLTGRAIFNSDYQKYFNAEMEFKAVEVNSINNSIFLSV